MVADRCDGRQGRRDRIDEARVVAAREDTPDRALLDPDVGRHAAGRTNLLPEDAEARPVPAILEYIPYRKRDAISERDETIHPYFAGHGYAAVRIDIRGSGDSEGLLLAST